jgi:Mlc titration factor MtfA (ptsG expression regulator)
VDAGAIVEQHLFVWRLLDDDERDRLLALTDHLLSRKAWEGARGSRLDDTQRVVVAAQAALLVLELGVEHYRAVSAVVVHPRAFVTAGLREGGVPGTVTSGPVPVLGVAQAGRGPVAVAWDHALAAAHGATPGSNVVLHEFAHKLDMGDGAADGTPLLPPDLRVDWARVCTDAYLDLVHGRPRPPLHAYAATNPSEFFAVATEVFFTLPRALRHAEPALYDVLSRFYRQDPANRVGRAASRAA